MIFPEIKAIVLPRNISSTYTYLSLSPLARSEGSLNLSLSLSNGLSCPTFTVTKKVFKYSDGHRIRFPNYSIVSFFFPPALNWDLQVASGLKVRRPEGPTAHLQVNIQFRRRNQTAFLIRFWTLLKDAINRRWAQKKIYFLFNIELYRGNKNTTSFQDRSVQRVLPPGQERPPEADRKPSAGADTQGLQEKVVIEVGRRIKKHFMIVFSSIY